MDFSKMSIDVSIEEFFSKDEYKNMCDLEKKHLKNLRLNYEMMLQFGLPALKPEFMKPRRGLPKHTVKDPVELDSDEDWRPRPKRKAGPKAWRPPYRPPSATVTSAHATNQPLMKDSSKVRRKGRQKEDKPTEERRVYTFRKRKDVNYMKLEVPNDDEFIYCEECDQEYQGDCPEHGPFRVVEDTPVPAKKRGDPQRALKTLPPGLEVRDSSIPNAGLGVFATQFFPTRSRFGPYQGRRVTDPDIAHSSGYCWQICTDERYSYFVDAKDCKTANWMRYVNCARTRSEQNVTAYQNCGEVYYRAHCDIQPGTEILVWYGREYGKELGIIREEEEHKGKRKSVTQPDPESEEHLTFSDSDVRTSDIEFSESDEDSTPNTKRQMPKTPKNGTAVAVTPRPFSINRSVPHTSGNTSRSPLSHNRSHVCQHCSAAFVMFNSLKLHVAFVHGEKLPSALPDRCDGGHCGNVSMAKEMGDHGNTKTVGRQKVDDSNTDGKDGGNRSRRHVCDVCSKAFTTAGNLKTHTLIHTGHKPFVCDVSSKAFTTAGNLKTHTLIHTGHKPFVCDVCSKAFTTAGHLKTHTLIHTGHKPFVCDVCSKAFTTAGHLKRHTLIHTGHKPFVCDVCSKAFTWGRNLKRHKRIHTGERPYKCPHCDADFNESCDLQTHIRSVHAGDRPYVCDVCGAAFSLTGNLERHKRIHTGEKPHVCSDCGKRFARSGVLKSHRLTHTGEKPHVCSDCGKRFARSGVLKSHRLTHTGEKPHVCSDCGKRFVQSGHLKRHRLTHTGEKPHVCSDCGKRFVQSGHLKKHRLTHTGEKPRVCSDCGKRFARSGVLKSHRLTHTGENPHTCPHCPAAFTQSRSLKKHVQKLHQ